MPAPFQVCATKMKQQAEAACIFMCMGAVEPDTLIHDLNCCQCMHRSMHAKDIPAGAMLAF